MRRRVSLRVTVVGFFLAVALVAFDGSHVAASVWNTCSEMIDLGTLGGTSSSGAAINSRGKVTGTAETVDGEMHAFLWTHGKMTDLGILPGMPPSGGQAINQRGEVAGTSGMRFARAFLWVRGELSGLRPLETGDFSSATAINERGDVAGVSRVNRFFVRATVWIDGLPVDLGTLGGVQSAALAINNRGWVTGWSNTSTSNRAFLWCREADVIDGDQ